MRKFNYLLSLSILALSLGFFTSCGDDEEDTNTQPETEVPATVVDIATADDNFSSLVAALTKADLVTTLQSADLLPFSLQRMKLLQCS